MYLSFLDLCIQNHQGLSQSVILDAHTMRKGDDFTYVCVCQCKQVCTYEKHSQSQATNTNSTRKNIHMKH